jgi:hypothetical protein
MFFLYAGLGKKVAAFATVLKPLTVQGFVRNILAAADVAQW